MLKIRKSAVSRDIGPPIPSLADAEDSQNATQLGDDIENETEERSSMITNKSQSLRPSAIVNRWIGSG